MAKAQTTTATKSTDKLAAARTEYTNRLKEENQDLKERLAFLEEQKASPLSPAEQVIADTAQPKAKRFDADSMQEEMQRIMKQIRSAFGMEIEVPSWQRCLAAFLLSIALAAGAGYGIGYIASMLMVGCFTLTGSVFLMYAIALLAFLLSAYAGLKIGQKVGNYVLSGQIDKDFASAKAKVTGFFKRKEKAIDVTAHAVAA